MLLDQPGFECDPVSRRDQNTPLHTVVAWANKEPPAQQPFAQALLEMMLEAGSNPRLKNRSGLTAAQLVDPRYPEMRQLIQKHEYAMLNAGDFVTPEDVTPSAAKGVKLAGKAAPVSLQNDDDDDDDAEFSGSDEEERAEWERRHKARRGKR